MVDCLGAPVFGRDTEYSLLMESKLAGEIEKVLFVSISILC